MVEQLVEKRAILNILGCLIINPTLLEEYSLDTDDFKGEDFHEIIFSCIYNLWLQGAKKIDNLAIDSYLSKYEKQYTIFNNFKGLDYCNDATVMCEPENFDYYYKRLKKFSLLRFMRSKGVDTSIIYNESIIEPTKQEKEMARLDSLTIEDIIDILEENTIQSARNKFSGQVGMRGMQIGKGMRQLKEQLKEAPEIGIPLQSKMLNTIVRGARLKKFYLRSGAQGSGKCVLGNTLIPTEKGLIQIQDIPKHFPVKSNGQCEANLVSYDIDTGEKIVTKTSHWYNMGQSKTVKIKTKFGYEIEGTPEHPIVIGNKEGIRFKKLGEITKEDKVIISMGSPIFGEKKVEDDYAYLLGFLIGDGYLNQETNLKKKRSNLAYSKSDEYMAGEVNTILQKAFKDIKIKKYVRAGKINSATYEFGDRGVIEDLKANGLSMEVSAQKSIPHTVMMGSKSSIVNFLQGLFDTDGSIYGTEFEYCTASEQLSHEVQNLLLMLGIVGRRRIKYVKDIPYYVFGISENSMLRKFRNEVGFRFALEKQRKLDEILSKEYYNSNVDFAYYIKGMIKLHEYLKSNIQTYKINKMKKIESYSFNGLRFWRGVSSFDKMHTSRGRIEKILSMIPQTCDSEIEMLRNQVNNMFFDSIDTIEDGEAIVYDFTVPNTHCFVANGTISHNTRTAIGDMCCYSIPWYYNTDEKKWEYTGFSCPSCFISTELQEDEVQTMVMAFVSGVNEDLILDGSYRGNNSDEEERVNKAIEYIEQAPFYVVVLEDFDLLDIENVIKKYKREYGVQYFSFDYIHTSMKMMSQLTNMSKGMKLREDQLLLMASTQLKLLCNKLNVHLDSGTQVNGEYMNVKEKNQNILAGAKAISNKIDVGIISLPPSPLEKKMVEEKVLRHMVGCPEPNLIYHIYKVRRGNLTRVMLWLRADLGTCRTKDLFVTDLEFNVIPIEELTIENIDSVLDEHSINVSDVIASKEEIEESVKNLWGGGTVF